MEQVEQFCENLIVLVNGKSVLQGNLKKIKKDFGKKNIHIVGDVDIEKIKTIKGVNEVVEDANEIIVKIEDDSIAPKVFDVVKKGGDITKFVVEEPSLNEIFVSIVGEAYENQD